MNKNQKRLALMGLAASMLLFLSGCVSLDKSGNPTGWVWNLLGRPMSHVITYFAHNLNLGFGLGIIFVTIIVRLIILPLGLHQSRSAAYQAAKREYLAPILEPINERLRNAETQEEKTQVTNKEENTEEKKDEKKESFWKKWFSNFI